MDAHRQTPEPDLMLREALSYVECGLAVFPVNGKIPFKNSHGVKDAKIDPNRVQEMWAEHPRANIAIACGDVSQIIVVDDDSDEARAELATLENKYGPLPPTAVSKSRRGHHRYYSIPEGVSVPHKSKKNGSPLEIISDGHYVLAPPSIHPSGIRYEWGNDITEFAEAPDWLVQYAKGKLNVECTPLAIPGDVSAKIKTERSTITTALNNTAVPSPWTQMEEDRLRSALDWIPAHDRDIWLRVGMALHWTHARAVPTLRS